MPAQALPAGADASGQSLAAVLRKACSVHDCVTFEEQGTLEDADATAFAISVGSRGESVEHVTVAVAVSCRVPLRIHWATADKIGGKWRPAPRGWVTRPTRSFDGGGNAWVTDLEEVSPHTGVHLVEIDLKIERPAFAFVLRTHQDRFIKCAGQDIYAPLRAAGLEQDRKERRPAPAENQQLTMSDVSVGRAPPAPTQPGNPGNAVNIDEKSAEERRPAPAENQQLTMSDVSVGRAPPPPTQPGDPGNAVNIEEKSAEEERQDEEGSKAADAAEPPEIVRGRSLDSVCRPLGGLAAAAGGRSALVDVIADNEPHCQRSLMHRYKFAAQQLQKAGAPGGVGQEQLAVLFVWFRFMSVRQLVINRNYNVKPREISAAQEEVTLLLAATLHQRPELRDITRLAMASIGRGGAGDMGQQIRDQILEVQKRNDCKGGMMEEWHQKLHNNTCPDDVAICEALLAYIDAGLDIAAYWARLAQDHITKERLASYDRKISSEPRFRPEQCKGLSRDLQEYLCTLKAVHSGADLQSAIAAASGEAAARLAKARRRADKRGEGNSDFSPEERAKAGSQLAPLPQRLNALLGAAQQLVDAVRRGGSMLQALEVVLEARWELQPLLDPGGGSGIGTAQRKDLQYLDMALESSVRTAVEGSLARLHSSEPEDVIAITGVVLENLAMSAGDNEELLRCTREWRSAASCSTACALGELALRVKAVADRVGVELAARGQVCSQALQAPAEALGARLGVDAAVLSTFSEQVARGGAAAPLAQLLRVLNPMLRRMAHLGAWQVISPFDARGRVECVSELASLQHATFQEPTVLVAEKVGGEEDIPQGVVAVITPDMPDVLSHVAVRARNERRLFASVFDVQVLEALRAQAGAEVLCTPSRGGDSVLVEAVAAEAAHGRHQAEAALDAGASCELSRKAFCGRWALLPGEFAPENTGGKSRNLEGLRGRMPEWIQLPASVAVPFGACGEAIGAPENAAASARLVELEAQLSKSPDAAAASLILQEIRSVVGSLKAPTDMTGALRSAFEKEGLPWPGHPHDGARGATAWAALAAVWASKWNDRSYTSCCKARLRHADVSMAVLCQQVVNARYSFVIHTTNPFTRDAGELYAELVCGLGEALVGNYAGRALSFSARKDSPDQIEIRGFPSKSMGLFIDASTLIFRSDSNAEDLDGYAGAGLYDSVIMDRSAQRPIDYSAEPVVCDAAHREEILRGVVSVGLSVEAATGSPQDVEGAIDRDGRFFVVQTRPQV